MTMFSKYRRPLIRSAILSTGLLLSTAFIAGCAPDASSTDEALIPSHYHTEEAPETTIPETTPLIETGATATVPEETVDMSAMMEEASISVISQDGFIGDYDFFTCNETQLFGDFSISLAEYSDEEYLMLSHAGIALLAKEDGSDAMLFYNDQRVELPFPCYFNMDYELISLHTGDFLGNGGYQLALVIPMDTGSGVDVDQLQIIDLDTMSIVPIHTEQETYEQDIRDLFDAHFAEIHPGLDYQLFQYIQYYIEDGLIFAEYGACDEDNNYLCFLEACLIYDGSMVVMDDELSFQDHIR